MDHKNQLNFKEPEGKGQGLGWEYGQPGMNCEDPSGTQDDALACFGARFREIASSEYPEVE